MLIIIIVGIVSFVLRRSDRAYLGILGNGRQLGSKHYATDCVP